MPAMAIIDKRGGDTAALARDIPAGRLLEMLASMHLLRAFDARVSERARRGEIPGLLHLGLGEEAVAVGVSTAIRRTDKVMSTHRGHGHFLAKGGDPRPLMAELYGKATGCCAGKGGSMHLVDSDIGFLGGNGVVGAGLPIAAGAALGARILGGDWVTIAYFGDGANNNGTFHETLNLASVWDLPVVFVCENNEYGISQSIFDQQRVAHVADRAAAYAMPAELIDGNDVVAVHAAVGAAAGVARQGGGPTLIECKTYRTTGHYEGDAATYRPQEEVEAWLEKDPIPRLETLLMEMGLADDVALDGIRKRAIDAVDDAVRFARQSPFPPPSDALAHVFAADGEGAP
jgi:pyruvate dehydrogenase E1 component alpha subunit